MRYAFQLDGRTYHVQVEEHADGPRFIVDGETFEPTVEQGGDGYTATLDGAEFRFRVQNGTVQEGPHPLDLEIRRARPVLKRSGAAGRAGAGALKPPMPGKVVEVRGSEGDVVKEGDVLVVLEAMKMQNDIKSPMDGTIKKVHVQEGSNVEATTTLLEVESDPDA